MSNLSKLIASKTVKFMKKHAGVILTVLASAGVGVTVVMAVKATPEAERLIKKDIEQNHDGNVEDYAKTDMVKAAWKCYIPTAIAGVSTIVCIVSAGVLGNKATKSLAGAYAITNYSLSEYQKKVKELYGEDAHNNIVDSIMKETARDVNLTAPCLVSEASLDFGDTKIPEPLRTFYDPISKRYFESTFDKVLQAEYHFNRNYALGGCTTLNDLYAFFGISEIEGGDDLGWGYEDGLFWIDFEHRLQTLNDGMEIFVIDMPFPPMPTTYYENVD